MGTPRFRTRVVSELKGENLISDDLVGIYSRGAYSFLGKEETRDENHVWQYWREITKDRPQLQTVDRGGEFDHTLATVKPLGPFVTWTRPYGYHTRFQGRLFAQWSTLDYSKNSNPWLPPGKKSDSEMDLLGTQAISKVAPTNPHADIATTLGELYRDGLPALPGAALKRDGVKPSSAGGEYLNYQFGIKPVVSDMKKIVRAVREADRLIKQYVRDSGRIVRRRYDFPLEVSSYSEVYKSGAYPPAGPPVNWYSTSGTVFRDVVTREKTWFTGAFTYFADERSVGPVLACIQQVQHLLGVSPDLESLYNLMPWSWFIDWFVNLGDLVNNISMMASNGLVMRWGYVMRETTRTVTYRLDGCQTYEFGPISAAEELVLKHQRRRRATPFGFGLLEEEFTPSQWAILTALGLAQGGRLKSM